MSGLELEQLTRGKRPELPVVLITGHEDAWTRAMSAAPVAPLRFLFRKPVDGDSLLAAVDEAVAKASPRT
jgi:FixJ family two-component response regulator